MPVTVTFLRSDLLVDILPPELDAIEEAARREGDPDRIANTIAEQSGKVDDYTRRYVLTDERQKRLIRTLCLYELSILDESIAEVRQTKYAATMKELEGIRDGKFPDLPLADPVPANLNDARGSFGSSPRYQTRS